MEDCEERHERAKRQVGMAPYGTREYWRNAAKVLSQHAGPGMRADTRDKLESLVKNSDDPETRRIAQNALNGTRYSFGGGYDSTASSSGRRYDEKMAIASHIADPEVRRLAEQTAGMKLLEEGGKTYEKVDDCFIATAALGTPYDARLDTMRAFRDGIMKKQKSGKAIVGAYYTIGPHLARLIKNNGLLRKVALQVFVKPVYGLSKRYEK